MADNSLLFIIYSLFFLAVSALFLTRIPAVLRSGKKPGYLYIFLLIATCIYGTWLRFDQVPQRFKVFYVGYETYNISRMIESSKDFSLCTAGTVDKCEEKEAPPDGTGLPFLAALAMKVSGNNSPEALFNLNALLGVLSIPIIFIMVIAGTGSPLAALFAALAGCVLPLNVILSGNATTENTNFLFLCITFTFLFLYMKNKDFISGLGLLCATAFSIFVEPGNIYTAGFILMVLLAARTGGPRGIAGALGGSVLIVALIFILPAIHRDVLSPHPNDFFGLMKTNISYIASNVFTPLFVSIPLVIAPVFLGRRCGISRSLFFFPFVLLATVSLFNIPLSQGDFPRYMLPVAIPMVLFFGITADWVFESIKNTSVRNGVVALCLALLIISSFNNSLITLRDFMEAQDDFIALRLPEAANDCSIYAAHPSIGIAYTNNPSYSMNSLLNEAFMKEHSECKVIVLDVACATNMKDKCQEILNRFKPQELHAESIFNYYPAIIGYISPDEDK